MTIEQQRLRSLIEFAQQTALLRTRPIADVNKHKIFTAFQHKITSLPGLQFNSNTDDELWLTIARYSEEPPPVPENPLLKVWLRPVNDPHKQPTLLPHLKLEDLVKAGLVHGDEQNPESIIKLESSPQRGEIERHFKRYLEKEWNPWSEAEAGRRETISLYTEIFNLKQQLDGNIIDGAIELVWGTGVAVWEMNGTKITYPIITQIVDLSLNESTNALELRPRDVEPLFNLSIYSAANNPGVASIEKAIREFLSKTSQALSPFLPSTFEPILHAAVTYLDPNGSYVSVRDQKLPEMTHNLQIADSWVLFARPRNASLFIQDLENFKKKIEDKETPFIPPPVLALVTEPSTENTDSILPVFRGLSTIHESHSQQAPSQDLFFPKPFNNEQVRIVQLLENSPGVVVQGPPGTGKTHTIANIICHYLATGKRVLVTSMKEPALAVLREKLPKEIQPLVICLLNNESDGMKQIEQSVSKISSEVQGINRVKLGEEITSIEHRIDVCHATISDVDRQIREWAVKNLSKFDFENEHHDPAEVAKDIVSCEHLISWFDDAIDISDKYNPLFSDDDIHRLRDARKTLGTDLRYLDCQLPSPSILPTTKHLSEMHELLAQSIDIHIKIDSGELFDIPPSITANEIEELLSQIYTLDSLRKILPKNKSWETHALELLRRNSRMEIFELLDEFATEMRSWVETHDQLLRKSIFIPSDGDQNQDLIEAIEKLSIGKRPFSFLAGLTKRKIKKLLDVVRITNRPPNFISEWEDIRVYIHHIKKFRDLLNRWSTFCELLELPAVQLNPLQAGSILEVLSIYEHVKRTVSLENAVSRSLENIFSNHGKNFDVIDAGLLEQAENTLKIWLVLCRSNKASHNRDQLLVSLRGFDGAITNDIFSALNSLGSASISTEEIVCRWKSCLHELDRIRPLAPLFDAVRSSCSLIENSGAPLWAQRLRHEPMIGSGDSSLPENWREVWRLKRLSTFLHSIDGRHEMKKLMEKRRSLDADLAKLYLDVVNKRTWLKIAENATPDVRSALMAYLAAILKIGKGKGKRAFRYRHDAKVAAARSHAVIPCWIMPHFRISESLPPEFGCFDLVIIDEASQSDLDALPSLLRAKKILIVGDDKQISPDGIGLEEEQIRNLLPRFLGNQVPIYRSQMTPERSIYDLFKVVFAQSVIMLKEHFRSVAPIIEYSKREFYNHELKPLRRATPLERLDPPLIDVFVQDGFRKGDVNLPEAQFIVDEIRSLVEHPQMLKRSIGVVSLLGAQQALHVWKMLEREIGIDLIQAHQITCGDARTFQGKERDIMFLSMVASSKDTTPLSRDAFSQRFNVAASRARDRMYLVRSVNLEDLSQADQLRRKLIGHFSAPFAHDEEQGQDLRELCESPFERELYDILVERGFRVIPQVAVGGFRIDMVVEDAGENQLAIECDGDAFHGPDQWEHDMRRQRILERAGWKFWRCFASTFVINRKEVVADLLLTLENHGIAPIGSIGRGHSRHVEKRFYSFCLANEKNQVE